MGNQSTPPPSIPEGKKIVERTRADGNREWVLRDDTCWIATAYYGDPLHSDVVELRKFRKILMGKLVSGFIVKLINSIYYSVGKTRFASWWRQGLGPNGKSGFRKISSTILLKSLLWAKRKLN